MKIKKNFLLKKFTTLAIGGPAKYFVVVKTEAELLAAILAAQSARLPWTVVGEGSNLVVNDKGYRGMLIQCQISKVKFQNGTVTVGAGRNLLKLIWELDKLGLAGMERMAGIPGTVGGAIYGCAGAYGQEIKDHLASVRFFDGRRFRTFKNKQISFGYRTSVFKKHKDWIITEVTFKFTKASSRALLKISSDTIKLREKKYRPGLKCPGSFFKNLIAAEIRVPSSLKNQIVYGKLPAGVLFEKVGAKGMRQGRIRVADHNANLIYNPDGGKASDVKKLAGKLKALVKKQFGIIIDEEVQY